VSRCYVEYHPCCKTEHCTDIVRSISVYKKPAVCAAVTTMKNNFVICSSVSLFLKVLFFLYVLLCFFDRVFSVQFLWTTNLTHSSFFVYVYSNSLHVSNTLVLIIRRINCINTTSGICIWYILNNYSHT